MPEMWPINHHVDTEDGIEHYIQILELGDSLNKRTEPEVIVGYGPSETNDKESMVWAGIQSCPYPSDMSPEERLIITRDVIVSIFRMLTANVSIQDIADVLEINVPLVRYYMGLISAICCD